MSETIDEAGNGVLFLNERMTHRGVCTVHIELSTGHTKATFVYPPGANRSVNEFPCFFRMSFAANGKTFEVAGSPTVDPTGLVWTDAHVWMGHRHRHCTAPATTVVVSQVLSVNPDVLRTARNVSGVAMFGDFSRPQSHSTWHTSGGRAILLAEQVREGSASLGSSVRTLNTVGVLSVRVDNADSQSTELLASLNDDLNAIRALLEAVYHTKQN
ncbi:MAG: hypothetical protein H6733_10170 [Alphaproteobacteria bacterium]|nr:hypothetical protein [Alphaproteobacteria bacterium]